MKEFQGFSFDAVDCLKQISLVNEHPNMVCIRKIVRKKCRRNLRTAFISYMERVRDSAQVKTTMCNYQNRHTFLKISFQTALCKCCST